MNFLVTHRSVVIQTISIILRRNFCSMYIYVYTEYNVYSLVKNKDLIITMMSCIRLVMPCIYYNFDLKYFDILIFVMTNMYHH